MVGVGWMGGTANSGIGWGQEDLEARQGGTGRGGQSRDEGRGRRLELLAPVHGSRFDMLYSAKARGYNATFSVVGNASADKFT